MVRFISPTLRIQQSELILTAVHSTPFALYLGFETGGVQEYINLGEVNRIFGEIFCRRVECIVVGGKRLFVWHMGRTKWSIEIFDLDNGLLIKTVYNTSLCNAKHVVCFRTFIIPERWNLALMNMDGIVIDKYQAFSRELGNQRIQTTVIWNERTCHGLDSGSIGIYCRTPKPHYSIIPSTAKSSVDFLFAHPKFLVIIYSCGGVFRAEQKGEHCYSVTFLLQIEDYDESRSRRFLSLDGDILYVSKIYYTEAFDILSGTLLAVYESRADEQARCFAWKGDLITHTQAEGICKWPKPEWSTSSHKYTSRIQTRIIKCMISMAVYNKFPASPIPVDVLLLIIKLYMAPQTTLSCKNAKIA